MKYMMHINNRPALWMECHSAKEFDTLWEAKRYLWVLAKQAKPEFGVIWLPYAVEGLSNWHMRHAEIPSEIREGVLAEARELDAESVSNIVTEALNEVYQDLSHYDSRDFVEHVRNAAEQWAKDCQSDYEASPQEMGWVGADGNP